MNKKILVSLSIIGAVAAIVVGGTVAFFSDTEKSTGNTFTAGSIDLKVDSDCHYFTMNDAGVYVDRAVLNTNTGRYECFNGDGAFGGWTLTDLTTEKFFAFADLKPGDKGENTISLHVDNNDAWACMTVTPVKNDDMTCTEPELEDGDPTCVNPGTLWDGELAQALTGMIWADVCVGTTGNYPDAYAGDNIYQSGCDKDIAGSIFYSTAGAVTLTLADKNGNVFTGVAGQPLTGLGDYYIGVSWNLPYATGNAVQSDSYESTISFYTEQARNNPNFICTESQDIGCVDKADVMLTLDRSGSIDSSEMAVLKTAAIAFVTAMNPSVDGIHMGQVSFASVATLDVHLTDSTSTLVAAINALSGSGGTNLEDAIQKSELELDNPGDGHDRIDGESPDYMVIITDGIPTASNGPLSHKDDATAAATAAKAKGITIYVVGIGSDVDGAYLANNIASSPAHYYSAANWSDLQTLLQGIGSCP